MTDKPLMTHRKIPVSEFDGRWQFRDRWLDNLGKWHQVRRVFDTEQEAQQGWFEFKAGLAAGEQVAAPEKITVAEWLERWLETVKETKAPTTYSSHKNTVTFYLTPHLGHLRLRDVDEEHVRRAYRKLVAQGLSTNTILAAHRRLRTAFNSALTEGKIAKNPVSNVRPPKGAPAHKKRTWTLEEVRRVVEWAVASDKLYVLLAITTGLRRGEIAGLRWPQIDLEGLELYVDWQRPQDSDGVVHAGKPKTDKSERPVPLDPWLAELLRGWRARQSALRLAAGTDWEGGPYVFTHGRSGKLYVPSTFSSSMWGVAEQAGVTRITMHEMRHTFATLAVKSGMDPSDLKEALGHDNIETTLQYYVHSTKDDVRKSVGALVTEMVG